MTGSQPDTSAVTVDRGAAPGSSKERVPYPRTGEQLVYDFIKAQQVPVGPAYIASRLRLNKSSTKVYCSRLAHKGKVMRTPTGYTIPVTTFEQSLEKQLLLDGQKHSLPKLHDIHLIFKPENIKVALKDPNLWQPTTQVIYEREGRGPDEPELHHPYIDGYNGKGYPSGLPDYLKRFFNTLDPDSIYQLWKVNRGNYKEIKGGFQEQYDFKAYKLTFQLFGTGTIKVMVAASEHPLDLQAWRETLASINSIFLSKTGIQFFDISNFFHFERLHAGNDLLAGSMDLAGITKLSCTVRQFDDWLYRTYEKVLGDELFVRSEYCLEKGTFKEHSFDAVNGMLALLQGGVTPTLVTAQLFKTKHDSDELVKVVQREHNQIHGLARTAEAHQRQMDALQEDNAVLRRSVTELITLMRQLVPGVPGFQAASGLNIGGVENGSKHD